MKRAKCKCCGQSSNLRKVECNWCGAYAMQSRKEIARGFLGCTCGGKLEPLCLEDRARCFPDDDYGREAWAELAYRFPGMVDPAYSARAKKAAATRKARQAYAAVRVATDPMPF